MSIVDRLTQFMALKSITAYEFERTVGVSNGYINSRKGGTRGIGSEILEKIYRAYPDLNLSWLITGDGNSFISNEYESAYKPAYKLEDASPTASPTQNFHDDTFRVDAQEAVLSESVPSNRKTKPQSAPGDDVIQRYIAALERTVADKVKIIELMERLLKENETAIKSALKSHDTGSP